MSRFKINEVSSTVLDTTTGLTWQREVPKAHMTWAEAKAYAAALDLDGGGWRLPTVAELFAIVDHDRHSPAIDPQAFPDCPAWWFWTATLCQPSPSYAWNVYFLYGSSNFSDITYYGGRVRCVR